MDIDIDRIAKNPETDIVIRIDEYLGRKGLTIREFVKSERYTGFTKAGTRIPADKFLAFKKAINSINEKDLEGSAPSSAPAQTNTHAQQSSLKPETKKETPNKRVKEESFSEVEF